MDDPLKCHTRLKAEQKQQQQQVKGHRQGPIMYWEDEEGDFRLVM